MVIALLDSATVPHGAAFWARTMAEQLARRGHRVTLLVPPSSPLREPPPRFGAELRVIPLRDNYDLGTVATLRSFLRRQKADVFLFQGSRGFRLGGLAALLAGVPAVARVGIGGGLKATAYDRWLCRRSVSHFIANAASIERELAALPWVGPNRITRIYNGIDLSSWSEPLAAGVPEGQPNKAQACMPGKQLPPCQVPEGRLNRAQAFMPGTQRPAIPSPGGTAEGSQTLLVPYLDECGATTNASQLPTPNSELRTPNSSPAPVIAVVARLQAHKGHEDLLRCLPALWERFPGLQVLLAGQGPHEAHLRSVAQELGADGQVLFLGHCADVRPVLAAADLFVLPSHREGLPNAVLEAMAMGVPVVAAAADGTGEVVLDSETGLLTPPGDVAALGSAVTRLLEDAPLRARLVEGAKCHLEEQFSLPRAVEQVEALLQALIDRGRGR